MNNCKYALTLILLILTTSILSAEIYPDQHYVITGNELIAMIESNAGMTVSDDGQSLVLEPGHTQGYTILSPDYSEYPFNRGLPSWNGTVSDDGSGFVIQMRFPYGDGWSPWLTVGYWKDYLQSTYGPTRYDGGFIDYDYVKLYQYQNGWQFKILMLRQTVDHVSPTMHKLSFFVSDKRTTDTIDFNRLMQDKPEAIFIPTDFFHQYALDPQIGGSICSPTSVSMILRSYDIEVDPVAFARNTYDPYHGIFGMWPRVVQNAAEYGLDGAVTRYRNWSEARKVLAEGGRIAMSVGPPLYTGHLMMLAGFSNTGHPIVHDPAKSNGYAYQFNKWDLSRSWFAKGGIAYTFYPAQQVASIPVADGTGQPEHFQLSQNYPNPFNLYTQISFTLPKNAPVTISVYDIRGRLVDQLYQAETAAGMHHIGWSPPADLPSGTYYVRLITGNYQQVVKAILLK